MCGIVGQHNFNHVPVDEQVIRRMNAQIVHRGPDDDGFYFGNKVAFGSRRLSIIDLSGGHMPLSNEDGTIWITFNGEIYNFLELREDLIRQGHVFKTRTDTEVIVHLYEQYGIDCLQHLNGMFAFGLWDENRQRLFLARDRIGKKPLVYAQMPWGIGFASEIAALIQNPAIPRELDYEAIDLYMTLMYIPSPFTIYKAVRKLKPGHYLVAEKGEVTIQRYWDVPFHNKRVVSVEEAAEELRELLTDAVRMRLISEVPLGAFLSGGVDSSAIVALMSQVTNSPVKTFAIGFESHAFNELSYARKVAERYKTEHHEFVVEPHLVEILPGLLRHYGEPFGDDSAVATYFVSKLAREFVTVALTGDGGDEVFGGYNRYQSALEPLRILPEYVRDGANYAMQAVRLRSPRRFLGAFKGVAVGAANILGELGRPLHAFANRMTFLTRGARRRLYSAELRSKIYHPGGWMVRDLPPYAADWLTLDKMFYLDKTVYLPDDILVKVDIASMANSLEVRCPILDYRILEWSASLPPSLKIQKNETKRVFRRAVQDLLPPEILSRQKMGFAMPIEEWIRGELFEMARDLLTDKTARERGLFNQTRVQEMLTRHKEGTAWFSMQLWLLLIFELWARSIENPLAYQ